MKSEERKQKTLKKISNPATIKAQALKWEEYEEKKAKMLNEFNKCISERTNPLPITKISYIVNSSKVATMRITRDNDPLNLTVYSDFRLQMLGFSEWLKVHALALKKYRQIILCAITKSEGKIPMVSSTRQETRTLTSELMDRKGTRFLSLGCDNRGPLVINAPEPMTIFFSFFMNWNTDIGFQRENEFHLAPTTDLIRIYNKIKTDSEIASEMFTKMIYVIEARNDCNKAREIVEKNLDNGEIVRPIQSPVMKGLFECKSPKSNVRRIQVKGIVKEVEDHLKTYSLAGMDISWYVEEYAEVLMRVRGGNTMTIMLPFEEKQYELKDCSLKKTGNLTSVYGGINIDLS
ncbi:hypothetical protein Tco_0304241 [Tanacetum coccineum]